MKSFFDRREKNIEDNSYEAVEFEVVDLDDTTGWTRLSVAEELAKHQAANLMEEIGDELAIIDAMEEDALIEELRKNIFSENDALETEETKVEEKKINTEYMLENEEAKEVVKIQTEHKFESEEIKETVEMQTEHKSESEEIKEAVESKAEYKSVSESERGMEAESLAERETEIEYLSENEEEIDIEYLSDEDLTDELSGESEKDEEEGISFFEDFTAWLANWTVMDKVIAITGVFVLVLAIATAGVYAGNRGVHKQIEAFAEVGEQLETVGVVGKDKLIAVADAQKAMQEAARLEAELNQEYEENELDTNVKVVLKMTSVQKDLKIKFVNKKTGKLVGNVPFEVKIVDADNKTYHKIDEDKDGIIYLTDIKPGDYSIAMVELADVEGYSFSTAVEKVKVKEQIVYEKVDVSDEIKDQSEVDVSKEDTAQKTETEATLADTVEWVESTKKEATAEDTYVVVDKNTIADPALSASLNFDFGILRIMQKSMLATGGIDTIVEEENEGGAKVEGEEGEEGEKEDIITPSEPTISPAIPVVTGVTLDKQTLELEMGKSGSLTVTVTADQDADKTVTWTSENPEVATVADGVVTAVGKGTAIITAKAGEITATCTVTVTEPEPEVIAVDSITLSKGSLELEVEETKTLKATVAPENATNKGVTWSSDNPEIATVDSNGKVAAVKEGTAVITARAEGKTATCSVTVKAKSAVLVTGVTVNPSEVTLEIGKTYVLGATVTPENAAEKKVTWTSSDESKATVDKEGCVTAKAAGTVTITVTTVEGNKTATCTVTISNSYDPKKDTEKVLKDKNGNQIYVLVNEQYVEAKVADYYKADIVFYKKEKTLQYEYTGWQNLDGKTYFYDKNGNKVTGEQIIQGAKYSFNSDGTLNTGSGILGIDVSTWNGNIDWNKVKNSGVSYVIIRTGFRGSTQGALVEDNKFKQNIQGATNAGLKVGVYFFSQAVNEVEAVEEASMVLGQIKGYKLSYPVFIDVEPSGGRADRLSSGERTKVINAFCQTIQNGGYRAGIYANKTWLGEKMNISALSGYKIWLAQYNSTVTYGGRYDMWQYSDKGTVAGISGKVDMNLSYLSY